MKENIFTKIQIMTYLKQFLICASLTIASQGVKADELRLRSEGQVTIGNVTTFFKPYLCSESTSNQATCAKGEWQEVDADDSELVGSPRKERKYICYERRETKAVSICDKQRGRLAGELRAAKSFCQGLNMKYVEYLPMKGSIMWFEQLYTFTENGSFASYGYQSDAVSLIGSVSCSRPQGK